MNRREVLWALLSTAACPLTAVAQQPTETYTILWVSTEAQPDPFIAGFREGMRERGYVEGRNLSFVLRYAPADPGALRAMLPDILATPADLIVSSGPAILPSRRRPGEPVLFAISGDPVELGIAESLARPGGNFTRHHLFMSLDVAQKRFELLKELVPALRTLAVLSNANHPANVGVQRHESGCGRLSVQVAYAPSAPSGA